MNLNLRLATLHTQYAPLLSICGTPNCFFLLFEMHGRCYHHFDRLLNIPSKIKNKIILYSNHDIVKVISTFFSIRFQFSLWKKTLFARTIPNLNQLQALKFTFKLRQSLQEDRRLFKNIMLQPPHMDTIWNPYGIHMKFIFSIWFLHGIQFYAHDNDWKFKRKMNLIGQFYA